MRLTRVRLAAGWPIFCPTSGAEDHSRTASAAPPTPCARSAGGTWTTPHLYPSPNSLIHFPLHLHLLQPSSSCPSRLMRIHPHTPPTPTPPVVEVAHLCVLLASLVHILVSTTQLFRVRVRGGALVGSRGRPPGLCGGARGAAHGGAPRDAPRACRPSPAPWGWPYSQLRCSTTRVGNDPASGSVAIAFERWPVGAHRAPRGLRHTTYRVGPRGRF